MDATVDVTLFCPQISTYGRIAAMTCEECGASWSIVPPVPRTNEALARQPFGKSPAAVVAGTEIYESVAICEMIDDLFNDGALQPDSPIDKARMNQWLSIANCYVFPTTEMGSVMPRVVLPVQGFEPRLDIVAHHLPMIARLFEIIDARLASSLFLAGLKYSLADIFLFVMIDAVARAPEGQELLQRSDAIRRWFARINHRPASKATAWPKPNSREGA